MFKDNLVFIAAFLIICASVVLVFQYDKNPYEKIRTNTELDSLAEFSFIIMGDNRGESVESCQHFKKMSKWMKDANVSFVIGAGNHVKAGEKNPFLKLIRSDKWWQTHFYPNIAANEIEYWGNINPHKDKTYPFYNFFAFKNCEDNHFSPDNLIYYCKIPVKTYQIHLFQISSQMNDSLGSGNLAIQFLTNEFKHLYKSEKDLVIVMSAIDSALWMNLLTKKEKDMIHKKTDLIVCSDKNGIIKNYEDKKDDSGALILNVGSVCFPDYKLFNGYLQVHFFKKPSAFLVQYVNTLKSSRELQTSDYAVLKYQNGKSIPVNFRIDRSLYKGNQKIVNLKKSLTEDELNRIYNDFLKRTFQVDFSSLKIVNYYLVKDIYSNDLMTMMPSNYQLMKIKLDGSQIQQIMPDFIPYENQKDYSVIVNQNNAKYMIQQFNLKSEQYQFIDFTEVTALESALKAYQKQETE
ncbi:MAG: hypothetical protein KA886_02575 [Candidatus Cloacimonetes bacterium]|nr:hypothetical protein [Candidatus Cloacimonadota bacterium]